MISAKRSIPSNKTFPLAIFKLQFKNLYHFHREPTLYLLSSLQRDVLNQQVWQCNGHDLDFATKTKIILNRIGEF